ncbi:MAG: glycosyltransferase [Gammaproteobacteria bacterium]|nr:glycosyltransferase [Gammaproteobacteria bacterium]NNL51744.1 glycosyltransferase [Woeseiaceae bacterium]
MNNRPSVSVVTPTFNAAGHIDACLESIRQQTVAPYEHIVVDGGSTDGTQDIARKTGAVVIEGPDAGIYHAMSKGVMAAQGDVIHILNADDAYADDCVIEEVIAFMQAGRFKLCHAKVMQISETGKPVWSIGKDCSRNQLLKKMSVAHPSVFVRKSLYERFGTFGPSFRIAGDQDWLLRVWDRVQVGYLDRIVVNMGMGGEAISQPIESYRESLAVAILHGRAIVPSIWTMNLELVKHWLVGLYRRRGGRRLNP